MWDFDKKEFEKNKRKKRKNVHFLHQQKKAQKEKVVL